MTTIARRRLVYLLLFPTAPLAAQVAPPPSASSPPARPTPVLAAADLRDATDLSGPWHYSIDPFRAGIAGFHGETPDSGQQRWREVDVRAAMAKDSRTLYEFDLERSPSSPSPPPG